MIDFALAVGFITILVAMSLCLWRLLHGPTGEDRILALDTLYINAIALIVLLSIAFASAQYFEAALLIAMMGFVGTIALGKYLARGELMD